MSTQTRLHDVAHSVRQLLGCEQVSLCLSCPNIVLQHPLIVLLHTLQPAIPLFYGSIPAPDWLSDANLHTLCDLSLLNGQSILEDTWIAQIKQHGGTIQSAMIVALERPAGIIGFLLCSSQHRTAFKEGERYLLTQYAPQLAALVEHIVSESCLPALEVENNASAIQEQSAFLALISHELRAPLMAIKGYTALLQEYGHLNESNMSATQQQRYLAAIMQQIKHLEVLLADTLDISQIQAGHLALHCIPLDINPLFQHIAQSLQYRMDRQQPGRYCIICTIETDLPLVLADVDRVQQILTNLLENAIKYSPTGGSIEIYACAATQCHQKCLCRKYSLMPEFVCITVKDQGIGIPRQQQAALFKPFTRLHHPATKHVNGTGLGLYIVRKFVEAMHGQVLLRSHEGKGTHITFTLPLAPLSTRMGTISI
jgi:signal transduction histidine kinase